MAGEKTKHVHWGEQFTRIIGRLSSGSFRLLFSSQAQAQSQVYLTQLHASLTPLQNTEQVSEFVPECMKKIDIWYNTEGDVRRQAA